MFIYYFYRKHCPHYSEPRPSIQSPIYKEKTLNFWGKQ